MLHHTPQHQVCIMSLTGKFEKCEPEILKMYCSTWTKIISYCTQDATCYGVSRTNVASVL